MTKSRFTGLLQSKKTPAKKARRAKDVPPPIDKTEIQEVIVMRPIGKRSKAEYVQVSAYIPKDTHKQTKAVLIEDGRDFSELVSDLLAEWLRGRE